jgi:thiamine biosynthesis protein ThiS
LTNEKGLSKMIQVNGEGYNAWEGKSLSAFLDAQGYRRDRIAVEANGTIIPQGQYEETLLQGGDVLEIVQFMGGG